MRIKTAILDGDKNYVDRLLQYFQIHYSDKLELSVFSDPKALYESLGSQQLDLLLVDSRIRIEKDRFPSDSSFVYARLCDSPDIEELEGNPAICKYQKADILFKQILSLYADHSAQMKFRHGTSLAHILLFTSAQGGSGNSAVAAACALHMAKQGKGVCYLDLQPLGDAEQYFSAGGNATFSDAIYALKSRKSNLIMKLESTLKTDSSGVDYFAPCKNAYDMRELKDEEIGRLLQAVAQLKEYEAIIVDVSGDLDERKLWLMQEYADRIICTCDGSEAGNSKFVKLYEVLHIHEERTGKQVLHKLGLLYNRVSSRTGQQLTQIPVKMCGGIRKYEGISGRALIEQIQGESAMDLILAGEQV